MAWVYILQSEVNNRFYIGSTDDLEQRLLEHNAGNSGYTKFSRPFMIVFSQEYKTLKDARYIENRLKRLKKHDYIENIVKDGIIKILPR